MDYLRIKKISEVEFDTVVEAAGGSRIRADGSADYLWKDAVVELKLVLEEGLKKASRQNKMANLFKETQPGKPVIVVDPQLLDEKGLMSYYNIVSGPIKNHVKKAAKQLDLTSQRYSPPPARVLIILNIGYATLLPDEFKAVCAKCVRNDTSKIDWVICGGIYLYSDKFDSYVIAPLEGIPIDIRHSLSFLPKLQEAWGKFAEVVATDLIRVKPAVLESKLPVVDLTFDLDGIRYVKPCPRMPKSGFWPSGSRPRDNSSGIERSPHVARTFPALSEGNWNRFRERLGGHSRLQSTYEDWLSFQNDQERKLNQKLKPFVKVGVDYEEFSAWNAHSTSDWRFSDICRFANHLFEIRIREVLERLKDKKELRIILPQYIELAVTEIGQDQANDLASIYYVSQMSASPKRDAILEDERLFFEYGATLAASYAVKRNVDVVVYVRHEFPLN
jgi:hypothetical protein